VFYLGHINWLSIIGAEFASQYIDQVENGDARFPLVSQARSC
jgi:hypothetical protein